MDSMAEYEGRWLRERIAKPRGDEEEPEPAFFNLRDGVVSIDIVYRA